MATRPRPRRRSSFVVVVVVVVRCVVRCPWGGCARVGDAVLDPARRRELAWRSGVRRNRRHVGDGLADVGTPIGVVTSASPRRVRRRGVRARERRRAPGRLLARVLARDEFAEK